MVIQSVEQLTPELLTDILARDGALARGSVQRVSDSGSLLNRGYVSNVTSLAITYSPDAAGALPRRLFMKMSRPNLHPEIFPRCRHEVNFYRAAAEEGVGFDIPHCYAAEVDEEGRTSLLLEDFTETHTQKPLPIPPSNRHCELIVEALARLHARWWNHPRLGNGLGERLTEEQVRAIRERLIAAYPLFIDYLGDALLPAQRAVYEKIFESNYLPMLEKRIIDQGDVTLVHGDTHTGNFLLPLEESGRGVVLVDWHLWNIHLATNDLAFFIALHWPPARRAVLERPLLERYHQVLRQHGSGPRRFADLWDDYRMSVILTTLIPIGQARRQQPAGVIWFGLQDSLSAFADLRCEELLW
jgi:thiamine kinase-like enzyme